MTPNPLHPYLSPERWRALVAWYGNDAAQDMAETLARRFGALPAADALLAMLTPSDSDALDEVLTLAALPEGEASERLSVRIPDEWSDALELYAHAMTPGALLDAGRLTDASEVMRSLVARALSQDLPLDVQPPSGGQPKMLRVSRALFDALAARFDQLTTEGRVGGRAGLSSVVRFTLAAVLNRGAVPEDVDEDEDLELDGNGDNAEDGEDLELDADSVDDSPHQSSPSVDWRQQLHTAYVDARDNPPPDRYQTDVVSIAALLERVDGVFDDLEVHLSGAAREGWCVLFKPTLFDVRPFIRFEGAERAAVKMSAPPSPEDLECLATAMQLRAWAEDEGSWKGAARRLALTPERFKHIITGERLPVLFERENIARTAHIPVDAWPDHGPQVWNITHARGVLRALVSTSALTSRDLAAQLEVKPSTLTAWTRANNPTTPRTSSREHLERVAYIPAASWSL